MQLSQQNNDLVIEYLKCEGIKDDGKVRFNYKVTMFCFC
jgi:hypothetical protein